MNPDEARVEEYLSCYGLQARRFSRERRHKTPDFRVLHSNECVFFCEVKSVERDTWLDKQFEGAASGTLVGGSRPDPIFNRLTNDIHTAIKQFDAVNPDDTYPNVLVFINHDEMCDVLDLVGVLTGHFIAAGGKTYSVYLKFSEGRIKAWLLAANKSPDCVKTRREYRKWGIIARKMTIMRCNP
jgi:hypothetical protein